jgi:hypothetical protein
MNRLGQSCLATHKPTAETRARGLTSHGIHVERAAGAPIQKRLGHKLGETHDPRCRGARQWQSLSCCPPRGCCWRTHQTEKQP